MSFGSGKILLFSPLVILISLFASYASTEEQLAANKTEMVIMEQIPYGFLDDEGQKIGVLYDIGSLIMRQAELSSSVELVPLLRVVAHMKRERKICTLLANTPAIVDVFDLVEPVGYEMGAGILPAKGVLLSNYSNLSNISIAVPLGIQFDQKFHNDDSLNKITVPQYVNGIKMLDGGRVDAIAGAISTLKYIAKTQGLKAGVFGKPLIFQEFEIYLVCNDKVERIERDLLQSVVIDLRESGKINEILDKYFSLDKEQL